MLFNTQWRMADDRRMDAFIKVRVKKGMAERLKKHGNTGALIRSLLEDYFEREDKIAKWVEEQE